MRKQVRGLYRRKGSPIWRYDFIIDGHRFSGSTETGDRREAERIVARRRTDKATDVAQLSGKSGMTFAAAATRWWTEAGQHRKDARDMVRALAWMQANVGAATKIAAIDANLISRLVAKRRGEGVSNSTVNRSFVEPLRAILMRAEMEWGQNVAKIAWRRHKLKEPPGRVRAMTRDERERLFSALDDRFTPVVRFLLASGVRRAEACGLRWSQVDLDAGRMSVPVKGGDVNHVPLSDAALLVIKSQIGLHPDFVFTYVTRRLYGVRGGARVPIVPETLYTAFRRALASAGLSGIRLHDTRHTAASRVLAETGSLTAAQRMLGHKDIKTTQRYAHLSDDQLRAALNAADLVEGPMAARNPAKVPSKRKVR